jgi:hypothetical protein
MCDGTARHEHMTKGQGTKERSGRVQGRFIGWRMLGVGAGCRAGRCENVEELNCKQGRTGFE